MQITIFGAGALGSVLGGMMAESHTVTMVCRDDHAREINADGLWLDGLVEKKAFPKAEVRVDGLPVQDLIIVTVKAYDTRIALRAIAGLMGPDTSLLIIQNGLTILRDVKELRPGASVGIASLGADYIGPGHVRLTGLGEIAIGNPEDPDDPVSEAMESLRCTGIPYRRSADIRPDVWKKGVISSCINPITALTRKRNAILVDDTEINHLARICFKESFNTGVTAGQLGPEDMTFSDVEKVVRATAGNRSSMLQDVERGKRTEIDHINGEIVREGALTGLDLQVNTMLVRLVSALSP
ncbi:MAG TPA: 2-dehydropantoate 2-reductase [Methanomassiliicoccales archaeon]